MKLKSLLFSLLLIAATAIKAQHFIPCATDEYFKQQLIKHPEIAAAEKALNDSIAQQVQQIIMNKTGKVLYVPVVFHIIHENGAENISQAQIMDQLRIVNEDFRKKAGTNGASTDPLATDMEIEFRLAQYDPNGNKHDGINRVFSTLTNNADDKVKPLSYWDARKYLNIWVVKSINPNTGKPGTVLGYAQFPWSLNFQTTTDGIVLRSDQVGTIGSGQQSQAGRTLTHEIGHWLGLYHTFQGGCVGGTSINCAEQGDWVCDTPPVAEPSFGCNIGRNSCSNDSPNLPDMVKNYMDYSDGTCLNTYTNGQKTRVRGPIPNTINSRSVIFGTTPNFNQNITYAGLNADGSYINVAASSVKAPYFYGFENPSLTADGWKINNFNNPNNGWGLKSQALNGSQSVAMYNFTNTTALMNSRDGFQSPEIDLSSINEPYLEFWYAYAQKSFATNDSFIVRFSNSFGMEETVLFEDAGSTLSTAGIISTDYIPTSEQWRKVSINLSQYKSFTNARFRFELLNRRGNNIYVDNFAITNGPTAVEESFKSQIKFKAYPNPASKILNIQFQLKSTSRIKVELTDVLGKEVSAMYDNILNEGGQKIEFDVNGLTKGIYFIRFSSEQQVVSHKILIN
jgi:hypothetical protein